MQNNVHTLPTKMLNKLLFFLFVIFLTEQNAIAEDLENEDIYEWVSIINLIATPERYHGKKIFVIGRVNIGLENKSLCLSEKVLSSKECLWIDTEKNEDTLKTLKSYQHKVISVHASFDMNDTGHFGGWSGGINKITNIYLKE